MERITFGVNRLDSTLGGGAPRGSVVLLAGEAGAGAREFMHTAAVMNGVARTKEERFNLHYGQLSKNTVLPEETHYLSFTASKDQLESELKLSMDPELVDAGLEQLNFKSLTNQYFGNTPVPQQWYENDDTAFDREIDGAEKLIDVLGETLSKRAPGNLVIIDSLSDLIDTSGEEFDLVDIVYLLKGMRRAAHEWGGLILVHVDYEAITNVEEGQLVDSCTGALMFKWATGGSVLARTLVLKSFRGVLSRIPEDDLVEFETELGDAGFTISDVRKIR